MKLNTLGKDDKNKIFLIKWVLWQGVIEFFFHKDLSIFSLFYDDFIKYEHLNHYFQQMKDFL
jgi:hypothetical protein